jgi:hypothetical protein
LTALLRAAWQQPAAWLRAALAPARLSTAAAAQRPAVVAAWRAATAGGAGVTVTDPGDGYRGGRGIPRFGAGDYNS